MKIKFTKDTGECLKTSPSVALSEPEIDRLHEFVSNFIDEIVEADVDENFLVLWVAEEPESYQLIIDAMNTKVHGIIPRIDMWS